MQTSQTENDTPTKPIKATRARKYGGVLMKPPYIDGALELNDEGLTFTDRTGAQVFHYNKADIKAVTLANTSIVIQPAAGHRFSMVFNARDTFILGTQAIPPDEVYSIIVSGKGSVWGKAFKARGYSTTDKGLMLSLSLAGLLVVAIIIIASVLVSK